MCGVCKGGYDIQTQTLVPSLCVCVCVWGRSESHFLPHVTAAQSRSLVQLGLGLVKFRRWAGGHSR